MDPFHTNIHSSSSSNCAKSAVGRGFYQIVKQYSTTTTEAEREQPSQGGNPRFADGHPEFWARDVGTPASWSRDCLMNHE